MKKFLKIYNDADDMYVLCNVSDIKFVTVSGSNPTTETQLFYNLNGTSTDQIDIIHGTDASGLNKGKSKKMTRASETVKCNSFFNNSLTITQMLSVSKNDYL